MTKGNLSLDENSISPEELSPSTLMRELNLQKKPAWILIKLMNALEKKRQAKGLGWSRSWNKTGLNVFRTHVQDVKEDGDYFTPLTPFLEHFLPLAPDNYRQSAENLLADSQRMAFTFYHNNETGNDQYEGLTLSLGRRVPDDPTKRDRLDVILEDHRLEGRVDGKIDRVRIYICPWDKFRNDKEHFFHESKELTEHDRAVSQELYGSCVQKYAIWKDETERQWKHWSQRYIDYFGPRTFIPVGTSFS